MVNGALYLMIPGLPFRSAIDYDATTSWKSSIHPNGNTRRFHDKFIKLLMDVIQLMYHKVSDLRKTQHFTFTSESAFGIFYPKVCFDI